MAENRRNSIMTAPRPRFACQDPAALKSKVTATLSCWRGGIRELTIGKTSRGRGNCAESRSFEIMNGTGSTNSNRKAREQDFFINCDKTRKAPNKMWTRSRLVVVCERRSAGKAGQHGGQWTALDNCWRTGECLAEAAITVEGLFPHYCQRVLCCRPENVYI